MVEEVVTKGGKPFESKLKPWADEVAEMHRRGVSYRDIASGMERLHGIRVSHNAVHSFLKRRMMPRRFYDGVPESRRKDLFDALTAFWTHHSTAIEGNTISLGDTMAILKYGLTIGGKSLAEHQEIFGHARAVERISEFVDGGLLTEEKLFELHRLVVTEATRDIYRPVGAWKREPNGTYGADESGRAVYMAYADPDDVPHLMAAWLREFAASCAEPPDGIEKAVEVYARLHVGFVRIHPFFDGNGRLARLVSNIPVLRGGHPPILVPSERRIDYIRLLWNYQQKVGTIRPGDDLAPENPSLAGFRTLLHESMKPVLDLVSEAERAKLRKVGGE